MPARIADIGGPEAPALGSQHATATATPTDAPTMAATAPVQAAVRHGDWRTDAGMPRNMSRSPVEGRLAAAREREPRRADSAWCAFASRAERSARRDGSSRRAVTRSRLQTLLAVAVRHADQRSGACAVALPSATGRPTRPISVVGLTEAVLAERRRRRWRGRRSGCRPGGWRRVRGSTRVRRGAAGRIWRGHARLPVPLGISARRRLVGR